MPKIINAYANGADSIADSLRTLGQGLFGDQARNDVYRQTALSKQRENDYAQPLADAIARGDRNAIAAYSSLVNRSGRDAADYNLLSTTNHGRGVDDPFVIMSQIGAHEPISSTAVGQARELAQRQRGIEANAAIQANAQKAIAERQAAQQQFQFEHTPEQVLGPDNVVRYAPRSQAMGQPVGNQPNHTEFTTVGQDQYGRPTYGFANKQTLQVTPAPTNAPPIEIPDLPPPPKGYPQAALDAANTSGIGSPIQNDINKTVGFLTNGLVGEIGSDTNRSRENLDQLANVTRELVGNVPGRGALWDRKQIDKMIPQPGFMGMTGASPGEQQNKVVSLTQNLRRLYETARQDVLNPNTLPETRKQLIPYLGRLRDAISMWETPPQPAGAPPAAPSAPAQPGVAQAAAPTRLRYDAQGNRIP